MKKIFVFCMMAMMASATVMAQDAKQLAKEQRELNDINMKMLNAKPSKDAKKQAKELRKQGWTEVTGGKTIEKQITESQLLGEERMIDELGGSTKRYIMHTGEATAGTYNAAYAASRNNAVTELAGMLQTQVVAAMQGKLDNAQSNEISSVTVDKFNQRQKSIIDACLTNALPVVVIQRVLPNNNYQVRVRISFDKRELSARLKRKMQEELEVEGDELNAIVDEVLGVF